MTSTSSSEKLQFGGLDLHLQPRERLLHGGAQRLLDSDLLALCLGSGTSNESVLPMAERLLRQFGGLDALLGAPEHRLLACHGLGKAKVALLKAVNEIMRRQEEAELAKPAALTDTGVVLRYVRRQIGHQERELFGCLYLDTRHRPIRWEILFMGSINRAHVHAREVLKRGLELNAAAVILAHNHPSGSAEPSSADVQLTLELKKFLHYVDIAVLDHLVVTAHTGVSLAARGLLGE